MKLRSGTHPINEPRSKIKYMNIATKKWSMPAAANSKSVYDDSVSDIHHRPKMGYETGVIYEGVEHFISWLVIDHRITHTLFLSDNNNNNNNNTYLLTRETDDIFCGNRIVTRICCERHIYILRSMAIAMRDENVKMYIPMKRGKCLRLITYLPTFSVYRCRFPTRACCDAIPPLRSRHQTKPNRIKIYIWNFHIPTVNVSDMDTSTSISSRYSRYAE